jgi:C-3',4' desaturase CrtD
VPEDETLDFAVVGAGFGGLAAAALLARSGRHVAVLEATGLPGGCAQTFRRGPFRFDAGATTVVGVEDGLPLGRLARALDITFDLEPLDPAMAVWLDGARIDRFTDREAWIDEAERHFGPQRAFWDDVFRTSDVGWRLSARATHFPPARAGDWLRTAAHAFPDGLRLLPALLTSTAARMRARLGSPRPRFLRFVDEQLLITAQAYAQSVPFAVGALGLSYTNLDNYAAIGGVGAMAARLVESIRADGGRVRYGHRVEEIERTDRGEYLLRTKRGDVRARGVVSNLTVWDLARVCRGSIGEHFAAVAGEGDDAWGAFTVYLGVRDAFGDERALHHQVIFDEPLPVTGGVSAFVSLSARGDRSRAPEGFRAVTISTHTPVAPWWTIERERYDDVREEVAAALLDRIANHSGLGRLDEAMRLTGTPRTFVRYTHRALGRVGGIPSTFGAVLRARPPVTPFPGFYLVGDTVYPGQGIPAVVLGALNVVERIGGKR